MNKNNYRRWLLSEEFTKEIMTILTAEKSPQDAGQEIQKFLLDNLPPPSIPKTRDGWSPTFLYGLAQQVDI